MSAGRRSYGGRSAQERAEDRHTRLVEAAITVLAGQGERATMTAICQEAGLTERYFYESFANRDAALVAALERVSDEISGNAIRVLQDTPGSTEERVLAMTRDFAHWAATHRDRAVVAVMHARTIAALRQRRKELVVTFAEIAAHEAAALYGDRRLGPGPGPRPGHRLHRRTGGAGRRVAVRRRRRSSRTRSPTWWPTCSSPSAAGARPRRRPASPASA